VPPLFSIIIPFFNSEKYLRHCIQSVVCQKFNNFEILLINDCSNDKSLQILKEIKKHKFIKIINNKRRLGVSMSRNLGIKIAKGQFLIFLDSDDILSKNFLYLLNKFLIKKKCEIIIIRNKYSNKKKIDKNYILTKKTKIFQKILPEISDFKKFRTTCWNYVVEREFLINKNIFFKNIKRFEDNPYVANLLCSGERFVVCDGPLYIKKIIDPNSLGKIVGFTNVNSCLQSINEICCLIKKTKSKGLQLKFLISRIQILLNQFYINLSICSAKEIKNINLKFKKYHKNFNILKQKNLILSTFFQKLLSKRNSYNYLYLAKGKIIRKFEIKISSKKKKKIFIFCAGELGKLTIKIFQNLFVNIEGVVDNNPAFYKKYVMSYRIENTSIFAKKKYKKSDLFIAVCNKDKNDFNLICNQLSNLELKKNQIVQFSI